MDYTIKIGGEAGQGIQTIGDTLGRVFARDGLHVFTDQDYESRIRGGHNFYRIRLADLPVTAPREEVDIIVALDRESIKLHGPELAARGQIIYDSETLKEKHDGPEFLDIPFAKLAMEHGGDRIMANSVATGAVLGMLGMDLGILLVRQHFERQPVNGRVIHLDQPGKLGAISGAQGRDGNGLCSFFNH